MDSAPENPAPAPENLAPAVENGDSEEARPTKKPRIGGGRGVKKRVAEIVLVLAAMARVRAGEKPTAAEIELMAEAREKLAELCEGLAPKDIVTREAVGAVIEDLGMNSRLKDQKLGFKGPRLTVAERFSQTKRKVWIEDCCFGELFWVWLTCTKIYLFWCLISAY